MARNILDVFKYLDKNGLSKLISLIKRGLQEHWIGTMAEYEAQKANIPAGTIVALTDDEDTEYDHGKYSTVETVTGQRWINGKPIYRKVIPWTSIGVGIKMVDSGIPVGVISDVLHIYTTIKNDITTPATPYWFGSDWAGGTSSVQKINAYLSEASPVGSNCGLYTQQPDGTWPANCKCHTIIEYTKKAD